MRAWLCCSQAKSPEFSIVFGRVDVWKKHVGKTKAGEITHPHGIKLANQVVASWQWAQIDIFKFDSDLEWVTVSASSFKFNLKLLQHWHRDRWWPDCQSQDGKFDFFPKWYTFFP
jgi:hypothetical protein